MSASVLKVRAVAGVLIGVLLASCGGDAGSHKRTNGSFVRMRYGGQEVSFQPTYAKFTTFKKDLIQDSDIVNKGDRVAAVVHRIYLANYDMQLTKPAGQGHRLIDSEGQYRVAIQIEADKDAADDGQLKVGEYVYRAQPFNRISWVFLSYLKDGKDRSENLQAAEFGGTVKITSVTDNEIEGKIDVFDRSEFVKGSFTARKLGQ